MNKKELIMAISLKLNKDRDDVADVFETMIDYIADLLKKGEEVKLHGFGKFVARPYGERRCYNPRTGEEIKLAASVQPAFIPSGKFRLRIQK